MIENVTTALQVNVTNGNGQELALPGPRLVTFRITGNGLDVVPAGAITIESGTKAGGKVLWAALTTITVPSNGTTEYFAGIQAGTLRARISQTVTGGTVTVLAVRPEEQRGRSCSAS